jgi:hypothetical protein
MANVKCRVIIKRAYQFRVHMIQPQDKTNTEEKQVLFTSQYIAPWALPKEQIPVHLVWVPNMVFDSIQVLLPSEMSVNEFYNVEDFEILNANEILIRKLFSQNYFGFLTSFNEAIHQSHESRRIEVNFLLNKKVVQSKVFLSNIYRPLLTVMEKPSAIILKDDSKTKDLVNISLKIQGFGRITVSTEISIGGKFEPNIEPLFQELTRRLLSSGFGKEMLDIRKKKLGKNRSIEINPKFVKQATEAFFDSIKKGELPFQLSEKEIESLKGLASDEVSHEKLIKTFSEHLENIIIDSLLFYFNRYPTDGVSLSGGSPLVIIRNADQGLKIRFKYKDSLDNEYAPVVVDVEVIDSRSDQTKELKLPLNIKWYHEQINPLQEGALC